MSRYHGAHNRSQRLLLCETGDGFAKVIDKSWPSGVGERAECLLVQALRVERICGQGLVSQIRLTRGQGGFRLSLVRFRGCASIGTQPEVGRDP